MEYEVDPEAEPTEDELTPPAGGLAEDVDPDDDDDSGEA
jgi:hypothetical protein